MSESKPRRYIWRAIGRKTYLKPWLNISLSVLQASCKCGTITCNKSIIDKFRLEIMYIVEDYHWNGLLISFRFICYVLTKTECAKTWFPWLFFATPWATNKIPIRPNICTTFALTTFTNNIIALITAFTHCIVNFRAQFHPSVLLWKLLPQRAGTQLIEAQVNPYKSQNNHRYAWQIYLCSNLALIGETAIIRLKLSI